MNALFTKLFSACHLKCHETLSRLKCKGNNVQWQVLNHFVKKLNTHILLLANIVGHSTCQCMQLLQMALGGTAVEFEKSLKLFAGWRENILLDPLTKMGFGVLHVFQMRIIQF